LGDNKFSGNNNFSIFSLIKLSPMSESGPSGLSFLYDFYKDMAPYNLTYIYRGNFSKMLNEGILSLSESNLNNISEDTKIKRKVYFIMVESLQNITRHEDKTEEEDSGTSSFFVIQRHENDYLITSGNTVENKNIDNLREKLEKVNNMDAETLKEYYKEILNNGEFSDKGGAGLGLIEMARKSGNKLAFDFENINNLLSYFYFQTRISKASPEIQVKHDGSYYFDSAKSFHKHLHEKSLNFIYQGSFSQENLKSILGMIEASMGSKDALRTRKKIFNILVEILQNIFKHGSSSGLAMGGKEGKEGIFTIGKAGGEYFLSSGNLVQNKDIVKLEAKLKELNNASAEQIDAMYSSIIMKESAEGETGAGLGLIDMKMKSGRNLVYEFLPRDNDQSFFSLQVTVPDTIQ